MPSDSSHVLVIGAGPAGLASSRELLTRGVDHVVLERGERVGNTWANLYDSLVLHTGKHLSALPGMSFDRATPLFPSRLDFLRYLAAYATSFRLPVETGASVEAIERLGDEWCVRTADGRERRARAVIVATGIVANPYLAPFPGVERYRGRLLHSVEYRRPQPFQRQRVLVVGAGNSAGEIAAELAAHGASVTIAVRSGARVVPRTLLGVPVQYLAHVLSLLPRDAQRTLAGATARVSQLVRGRAVLPPPRPGRCSDIPLIGFHLVDALRAGRIRMARGIAGFTPHGVRFDDGGEAEFEHVIMATGYRPALAPLGANVQLDPCGFALRRDRVASATAPDLYFVGQNYDLRGALRNIAQDARLAAHRIARGRAAGAGSTAG